MQSNPTPDAPQAAPRQRKPLVFFSCCCKLSELMQLAKQLQQMEDDAQAERAGQDFTPATHPLAA